ncbi:response regulator transcription factor [Mucilaginibacter sp. ZT4R22]|uniref:Response regulator transcription factor n=1 Tax=Mucilaginibacter pankratovii TaxID=2772110 RepID=A0ABR7WYW5_9SPHI|nr:LytTR family DNA-binding domain-containing protein [Mucilaginibacter pankratovii]MBD1367466.1 response regulator transcription factor [Mucilaginibacter pankratovii]
MNINAVIIDDEPHNIENLQGILTKWCTGVTINGTAEDVESGIALIRNTAPDLVFLDIQLTESSGFDVLKAFTTITFEVIFVTAYDHYGIQAIKFSALDYLLKPINVSELQQAVEKAKSRLAAREQNLSIANLVSFFQKSQQEFPKIALPTSRETRYVKVDQIIRCEASNNYTTFFIQGGDQVLVSKTLKEFEELLKPYDFQRTHQSHLVNLQYVKSFLKEDNGMLLMDDRSKIPISRQSLETVKKALNAMS